MSSRHLDRDTLAIQLWPPISVITDGVDVNVHVNVKQAWVVI